MTAQSATKADQTGLCEAVSQRMRMRKGEGELERERERERERARERGQKARGKAQTVHHKICDQITTKDIQNRHVSTAKCL